MHSHNGAEHIDHGSERCNATEKADDQPEPNEELRSYRKKSQKPRKAHLAECLQRSGKTGTSKPAQHFLCAMGKKHDTQYEPQ